MDKKTNNNQNLPSGWRKVKLGEIVNIKMGQSPSSQFYNSRGEGLPFYQGITDFGSKYPNKSVYCTNPIKIAEKGEILFSVRAPVGEINIAIEKSCIGRGIAALSMKNNNNAFLYYLLKYNTQYFKNISGGTTYEAIGKDQILEIEIEIPEDPNEQKRIADILSDFDDKIEVNNKIIKTLETMAQEIFKEWFNKKSKFKSQKSKFEDWEIGYLGDGIYSEIIKPGVKRFEGEKIYLATSDVDRNEIINEKTKVKYNNRPIRANMEPVLNSIWFAKMINTYKVLFFFEGNKEDIEKYIISTGFMGIKALKKMHYYLYLFINSKKFHQIKDTLVQGAVQEAITNSNVKQINFLIPPENLLDEFNKKVEPILLRVYKLKKENQTLAAIRNLLLPKLMRGEIRI